jgi:hypothetical protein
MNYLIVCKGFIGDILFASSIAKKLKEEQVNAHVDYAIPLIQPSLLLEQNPYIDAVYVGMPPEMEQYDKVIHLPEVNQAYPATYQFQLHAGVKKPSLEFPIYTVPEFDVIAKKQIDGLRAYLPENGKVIGWQVNWEWKAYQTTPELLRERKGGPHRNIDMVINRLREHKQFVLLPMGFDRHVTQHDPVAQDSSLYTRTASLIKYCDWMIGSEGGLTNLAAGIGTRTIITTDYIWQNYGPQGFVRQCDYPAMGPAIYYPNAGHVHLDPYITDDELYQLLYDTIENS